MTMWLGPSGETPSLWLRLAATYGLMGLAVGLLALLSGPPEFSDAQWAVLVFVVVLAALAIVYVILSLLARLAGWKSVPAEVYRAAAAGEASQRGRLGAVFWDGVVGWGWPVGFLTIAVQQFRGGQDLNEVTALQAGMQLLIWSVAGGVFGLFFWDLSKKRFLKSTYVRADSPERR